MAQVFYFIARASVGGTLPFADRRGSSEFRVGEEEKKKGGKKNMNSAVARCSPRFPAARVAHPAFSNRNKTRLLTNHFSGCSASALSLRLGLSRVSVEASATAVLDCGFRRVIAYPPGGGAVTLIQTQRANSHFEVSRHEMPVPMIAFRPRSEFRLSAFVRGSVGARHAVPTPASTLHRGDS